MSEEELAAAMHDAPLHWAENYRQLKEQVRWLKHENHELLQEVLQGRRELEEKERWLSAKT